MLAFRWAKESLLKSEDKKILDLTGEEKDHCLAWTAGMNLLSMKRWRRRTPAMLCFVVCVAPQDTKVVTRVHEYLLRTETQIHVNLGIVYVFTHPLNVPPV